MYSKHRKNRNTNRKSRNDSTSSYSCSDSSSSSSSPNCGKKNCKKSKCQKKKRCNKVKFFPCPITTTWGFTEGEVVLFEKVIKLRSNKCFNVDASFTTEITGPGFIIYKLYINGCNVAQSAFEAQSPVVSSTLDNSILIWGGCFPKQDCITLRITAQIGLNIFTDVNIIQNLIANVDNTTGGFQGAKGATLRITFL